MVQKHIAVTGPTAGIGRAASLEFARRGLRQTLFCRNPEKAADLAGEIADIGGEPPTVIRMDMADLSSVRRAAQEFLEYNDSLDVLLNNAGTINTSRRESKDGFEETLAVNHFAPFLLTGLLLSALRKPATARIVNVSSNAHAFVRDMNFDDLQASEGYRTFREYGRSKLANILFTRELARRLQDSGITVNCLHPGAVSTSLGSHNAGLLGRLVPLLLKPFFRSPERGAATSIYLCCSEEVARVSGEYFVDCQRRDPKPWAMDDAAAAKLWSVTEACIGFEFPA